MEKTTSFPINWNDNELKRYAWTRSQIAERYPYPVTPLFGDIFFGNLTGSVQAMADKLGLAKQGYIPQYKILNGYVYGNMEFKGISKFKLLKLLPKLYGLADRTEREFKHTAERNHIKRIEKLKEFDYSNARIEELHQHLVGVEGCFKDWMVHQSITVFFITVVLKIFEIFNRALFNRQSKRIFFSLIAGFETESTKVNAQLLDLAYLVVKAGCEDIFKQNTGKELLSKLDDPCLLSFKKQFKQFLERNGYQPTQADFVYPIWQEAPEVPLNFIRTLVLEKINPNEKLEEKKRIRENTTKEIEATFEKCLVRKLFKKQYLKWLDLSQRYVALKERRPGSMYKVWPLFKNTFQAISRFLIGQGLLEKGEDLFFLHRYELEEIISKLPEFGGEDFRAELASKIFERKKLRRQQFTLTPPSKIKYGAVKITETEKRDIIKGITGNPGKARGVVRIITGADGFHKLNQGDILVVEATNPSWTPLFSIAAGVVTETGGILSHACIVAREYNIPAVVDVAEATRLLKDGDLVEVDAAKATVRVLEKA